METITLTINGNAMSVRAGRTILEVARQHGIYIPTLCHHEALRPIGACRLCQVEDEKRGVVVPACVTKAAPGMVIVTDSERVRRNRKNILRLLMAAHPESCVVCEKGNACELRNLAARHGIGAHGLDPMPYHPQVMDLNPFMSRDLSKCIMCAKCVRADQEVVCEGVIDYNFRGFDAHPSSLFGRPLENAQCTFCGTCLTVCPTGAIAEKGKRRMDHAGGRSRSVCTYCGCGCSIFLEHDHEQVRGITPTALAHTANGVSMCVRGHFGHDYLGHPDRLRTPLIRNSEGFRPASWDEALDLVASRLGKILDLRGPAALGFWGGGRSTNEEAFLFQKLARDVYGTNNVDSAARIALAPFLEEIENGLGGSWFPPTFADVENSDAVLVIGADPSQSAPVLGYHLKRAARSGRTGLVLADPLETGLAPLAQVWLRHRPTAEKPLLWGLIKVVVEEGLAAKDLRNSPIPYSAEFSQALEQVTVDRCAAAAGVDEDDLRAAARLLAEAEKGAVVLGDGLALQAGSRDLARLAVNLVLLTGLAGPGHSGLLLAMGEANTMGATGLGLSPQGLPGGPGPAEPGLDAYSLIQAAADGHLQGLYVHAANPVGLLPRGASAAEALSQLGFLVVHDLFLTDTAKLAHVVLPAAAWSEKGGTVVNMEGRVQRLHQAVPPPGGFPEDSRVFTELARRAGREWPDFRAEELWPEIERVVPLYRGVAEADLDGRAVFLKRTAEDEAVGPPFSFLAPNPDHLTQTESEGEYPFILLRGPVRSGFGSGARSSKSRRLQKAAAGSTVGLCAQDMARLGIEPGQRARVVSAQGNLTAPVALDERLPTGLVFMPTSFPENRPGELFPRACSGSRSGKDLRHCRVKVEKVND